MSVKGRSLSVFVLCYAFNETNLGRVMGSVAYSNKNKYL